MARMVAAEHDRGIQPVSELCGEPLLGVASGLHLQLLSLDTQTLHSRGFRYICRGHQLFLLDMVGDQLSSIITMSLPTRAQKNEEDGEESSRIKPILMNSLDPKQRTEFTDR